MQLPELLKLEAKFLANVLPKNPIVHPLILRRRIYHLHENGPDWSSSTCLVGLTCALGAISEAFGLEDVEDDSTSEPDILLALQYWELAVKRLGIVIGQNTVESVQCLCLAG